MRSSGCPPTSRRRRWEEGQGAARVPSVARFGGSNTKRRLYLEQRAALPLPTLRTQPALHWRLCAQLRKKRLYLKQRAEEARADASEGSVPIYAPDPALAPSFDPEVTGYRYKVLEDPAGIIAR